MMKNYKIVLSLFIPLSLIAGACSKSSTGTAKPMLTLSKSVVMMGEPLVVSANGITAGSSVQWSASPHAANWSSSSGDSATYLFTSPGTYRITATYLSGSTQSPYDSSSTSVTVSDSLYNNDTTQVHCNSILNAPFSSGDQINLTPIYYSDSAGLVLLANTRDIYNYIPTLMYGGNLNGSDGTYECDFNSVMEYPCDGVNAPAPATGDVFFNSLSNGTYSLVFKLNGTTYQGSLVVSDASCTFNWNYTSGVVISPLQIRKL